MRRRESPVNPLLVSDVISTDDRTTSSSINCVSLASMDINTATCNNISSIEFSSASEAGTPIERVAAKFVGVVIKSITAPRGRGWKSYPNMNKQSGGLVR